MKKDQILLYLIRMRCVTLGQLMMYMQTIRAEKTE